MTDLAPHLLDACSREPIHIPGAIQPQGALLVFDSNTGVCLQASVNAGKFLAATEQVVGAHASAIFPELASALRAAAQGHGLRPHFIDRPGQRLEVSLQAGEGGITAEVEEAGETAALGHHDLLEGLASLRAAGNLSAQHEAAVRFVARLTGFERVMLYRFDPDWNGQVLAECLADETVDSYLGLHFPAADIPAQARELYRRNWLRLIPDATYTPVPVEPSVNPRTQRPLDMSSLAFRSVSPVHLQYLRNMGVCASMSISLVVQGRLWGLIACHDRQPRFLPRSIRSLCEIFGQVASFEIESRETEETLHRLASATAIQTQFFNVIAEEQNVFDALVKYTPQLLLFMAARGAALHVSGRTTLLGETPSTEQVEGLLEWLKGEPPAPVFATDFLAKLYPPAAEFAAAGSGLLVAKLSRVEPHYMLWFRPEVARTVEWAGEPRKVGNPAETLTPRISFATWRETVTGRSAPWREEDRRGAEELILAINALVLRRTETLLGLNAELEKKNTDLNSFAYIAAHDLREPLRGVENVVRFIKEDHGEELSAEVMEKLDRINGLVHYSKELIDALNHYSNIGRMAPDPRLVNLDAVLDQALSSLLVRLEETKTEVRRPHKLPAVVCDPILVREIFTNLLTNSMKYSDGGARWIEIGRVDGSQPPRLYVRDNGIGVKAEHFRDVFKMFRRLHPQSDYGGGTGAGLAIVQAIAERHGGQVGIESVFGEGTTIWIELEGNRAVAPAEPR